MNLSKKTLVVITARVELKRCVILLYSFLTGTVMRQCHPSVLRWCVTQVKHNTWWYFPYYLSPLQQWHILTVSCFSPLHHFNILHVREAKNTGLALLTHSYSAVSRVLVYEPVRAWGYTAHWTSHFLSHPRVSNKYIKINQMTMTSRSAAKKNPLNLRWSDGVPFSSSVGHKSPRWM